MKIERISRRVGSGRTSRVWAAMEAALAAMRQGKKVDMAHGGELRPKQPVWTGRMRDSGYRARPASRRGGFRS